MGIHRADDGHPNAASIRRQRRMSRNAVAASTDKDKMTQSQSIELQNIAATQKLENLGNLSKFLNQKIQ